MYQVAVKISDDVKNQIIRDINVRIGDDINDLGGAYEVENELVFKRDRLQSTLNVANTEVPTKLHAAIKKAEKYSKVIEALFEKQRKFQAKTEQFLIKTQPLLSELNKRFTAINKLEEVLAYTKTYEKVDNLSAQLKQCHDKEQLVQLYGELKEMYQDHQSGHQAGYIKEYTHYWHNVLKDKLTKNYEDILKTLKWPFTTPAVEHPPPQKEVMIKFTNITKYLFLIQEPEDPLISSVSDDLVQDQEPCLPVRILLRPLKKRFAFHFSGSRQTARIDRPEWFLTQTLTWIKDHHGFIKVNVQPVADKLRIKNVDTVEEFNAGLIQLAAERLHTILALYHSHGAQGDILDVDAAFAHAVDETLGFHKELAAITGTRHNSVLSVLTKAENFIQWLAVEKKYALAKLDEILDNPQWMEPVGSGAGAGAKLWAPRAADLFVTLLSTVQQRYANLPSPGHRLQFLELQLDVLEEWRVRLTQLVSAGAAELAGGGGATTLYAAVNAAHHTQAVLLQWAHSLHYLQLHYYRRQFQHFTQRQHQDIDGDDDGTRSDDITDDGGDAEETSEAMCLREMEQRAKKLALNQVSGVDDDIISPLSHPVLVDYHADPSAESGVFAELPALLARLSDQGLEHAAEYIFLEFKAATKEYKKQKWHAMITVEEKALTVSPTLCRALAALCASLNNASKRLAPPLTARLRAALAAQIDEWLLQEVILASWFNTGGTIQITHDLHRNLIPAFAPPNKSASQVKQLPKLIDACKLLNLDYDDARRLRASLLKNQEQGEETLCHYHVQHLPFDQVVQILNQRTDLNQADQPASVMELF